MNSLRTTIAGFAAGLALIAQEVADLFDNDPLTIFDWPAFLAGLAVFGIGVAARDNNKTSEEAGAGQGG